MAIKRPDIYEHNNPVLSIADSDFVRGGGRVVADLTALYALSSNSDQLKERVTKVWVTAESAYYILVDDANIGNSNGWAEESSSTAWGSITGTISSQTDLQTALDGKVDENAAITGATKTKITYDAKGLVTAGADATTADIADSTNKRYVTDAQLTVIGNTSGTNTGDNAVNSLYSGLAASKQDTLVSGTNIKTINSTSLLGSGDISVAPASGINATAIGSGTVDNTEFGYLNGVTSAIQTQVDAKIAKSTGTTYNVYSLAAVTQAEYNALTPNADTIYFII